MSILQQDESSLDITLGQVLRLPCKFIQGKSDADKTLLKSISQQLSTTGKNILPVIVKALDEDDYQAVLNTQILDAAKLAKLDFVWCIVVDEPMLTQVQIESGQLPQPQVNVLTASEQELIEAFEYIKAHRKGFEKVKPNQAAKAIVEHRKSKKPKSLSFLTNLKCGIGKAKILTVSEFLVVG
ncbi:MAG TPA: hypothetical protein V6C95_03790 [Coleofasciculaceae cyanobacterium]